ncbi:ABC transporter substrate-binding protein [Kribbella antibiotica]|uniref:ABC transporter substrate-binding protein n=1 Tax=Kribbella antibiotica TaxID=190195 RepID=A0A4R4ZYG2_9ACTN|nr:ABC transporter substrate-binding protein [Kribbella antibiotica]TDD63404.1 ABC transporter substrate-binding protein [Kribbella antibiotica]
MDDQGLSRRTILGAGAGLGAAAVLGSATRASAATGAEETRSLDELYRAAVAESGKLVIYAGGDTPTQQQFMAAAFRARFPEIDLTVVVDYSKFHDVRIDNQLATGTLVPDVAQLQTLQNFDRWKREGRLLRYKPAGFSRVYDGFKDSDAAWAAIAVYSFSFSYDADAAGAAAPRAPRELTDPRWRGKIASAYPNDDDATLYLFKRYAEVYGWSWIAQLAEQQLAFARGSDSPAKALAAGQKTIGVGGSGDPRGTGRVRWVVPASDPFMAWGQRAAIFAAGQNRAAAKLYLNWQLSKEVQQTAYNGWSVRTDVTPGTGLRPIWTYRNANLDGFPAFMADRGEVERWRQTFSLYFGEVTGAPSPGWLGLHPGR